MKIVSMSTKKCSFAVCHPNVERFILLNIIEKYTEYNITRSHIKSPFFLNIQIHFNMIQTNVIQE